MYKFPDMNIEYRNLLPDESKVYRKIRLESLEKFPEAFGTAYKDALKTEKFRIESDIEHQTLERFVFGAFTNGLLVGICAFVKDENNTGNIYQMYIQQDYQGKRMGQGLIEAVLNEAYKRFNDIEITLGVTSRNSKAYNLYRKIGFRDITNSTSTGSACSIVMKHTKNT